MSGEEPAPQMAPVESPQMISTVKLPMLKKGEYTLWSMRMEQYLTNTDYGLWQVIMNGDEHVQKTKDENGVETESLWAAIKCRFGGNVESKKTHKNVLKQQFENFSVSDTEGLDKAYDRFQKLISQLEIHGAAVSNEDANHKFLRALPLSWNNIALIMRNKEDIDELDIDDLYNNLKVFEVDIKACHSSQRQASSSSYTNDLMFSFFADQSSGPQLDDEDLEQIDQDNLEEMDIKWECRTPRNQGNRNGDAEYRSRDNTRRTIPVETSDALVVQDNALIVQDGLGYDWSYIAQDEPTEFALMAYTSNSSGSDTEVQSCFKNCVKKYEKLQKQFDEQRQTLSKANLEIVAYQLGLESVEVQLVVHQKNEVVYEEKIAVLEFEVKDKGYGDQLNENDLSSSELFNSVFDSRSSDGNDNQTNDRFKKDNEYHAVPPPLNGNYIPPLADLSFIGLDDSVYRHTTNKTSASVSHVETSNTPPNNTCVEMPRVESVRPNEVIIEDWVSDDEEDIFQSGDSQTTVNPSFKKIEFTKTRNETVKSDQQAVKPRMVTQSPNVDWNGKMTQKLGLGFGFTKKACFVCGSHNHLIKDCDFHEKRMPKESVLRKGTSRKAVRPIWNNTQRINHQNKFIPTAILTRVNGVNTAGQIAVSTVKGNRVTAVKASAGCVWRPKKTDLNNGSKDNSGSWISKRGNPQQALKYKGMFDSGCSRHMTGNKALLTDYQDIDGGFVAFGGSTRGGKITDLTCLFAKAIIDESKLWHRRLGHVNFKTMNKLVKGNLVRGLPSKTFENDHTCVACQKGKQHKASCKTKLVSSISQPLQMLHMDLFGPTSVRSINHKTYCLVVTDDFSRFSWVFFLATKSETSGILKKFITEIENQLNHKVKVIRSDNGTEFKNKEMDEFCGQKGIKREYSVARTS
ncbi:putative ribonuclease H-like domain-containing protein [Tanacetum coccineum]